MPSRTENEFDEYDSNNEWNNVFQRLRNESSLTTLGEDFSTSYGRSPDNRRRNRYRDVTPYDHSRVVLSGENDYINANHIQVPEANRRYILTQGPLDHTMCDFWQMTWEQDSRAIVMLNRIVEKGTLKCSQYWPIGLDNGHDDEMYFPENGMRVSLVGERDYKHFTLRTLEMEKMETGEKREVFHFHYTTWPDFGVPSSPTAFLHFLHAVRQTGSLNSNVGPAIIHCSAGIGRSGTFCLVDSCLVKVEEWRSLELLDVKDSLIKMRYFRMGLIQTADQLRFSYQAIIQGAHTILNGQGLASLEDATSLNTNHSGAVPPPPPERGSSLSPPKPSRMPDALRNRTHSTGEEPPPLPPKQNNPWPHDKLSEDEVEEFDKLIDRDEGGDDDDDEGYDRNEDDAEFDKLIDVEDDGESSDEENEAARLALAEQRHSIREQRKKETMEKIRLMKEKQRKSERCRSQSYFGPKLYFGLAVLVGVAGVVVYKYFW